MKRNNKKLSFEQRVGWFLLSCIITLVGLALSFLFPIDITQPDAPSAGTPFLILGIGLFVYSFFAKESLYSFYSKWFEK